MNPIRLLIVPFVLFGCQASPQRSGTEDRLLRQLFSTHTSLARDVQRMKFELGMLGDSLTIISMFGSEPPVQQFALEQPSVDGPLDREALTLTNALTALRAKIGVHENNIANVNTSAFKKSVVSFADVSRPSSAPSAEASGASFDPEDSTGAGVQIQSITKIYSPGVLEGTGRELDVAIDGSGFLRVRLLDGSTGFTRDGRLHINADGELTTVSGDVVEPRVILPQDFLHLSISPSGQVAGRTGSNPDVTTVFGQLSLTRFASPTGLRAIGGNIAVETVQSGPAIVALPGEPGVGIVRQAFIERSNVEIAEEYMELRLARRQYAMIQQMLLRR